MIVIASAQTGGPVEGTSNHRDRGTAEVIEVRAATHRLMTVVQTDKQQPTSTNWLRARAIR